MKACNVILTGFMGTGKSSAGRILARRLGYEFIDTDQLIEARQKRSVAEIFAGDGEPAFRAMETEVALELGRLTGLVIATGGRLMLDAGNAQALERSGPVYCLSADPEEIIRRLSGKTARSRRPLLKSCDLPEYVHRLLAERGPAYRRFTQIDTTGLSPRQVAGQIHHDLQQCSKMDGMPTRQ